LLPTVFTNRNKTIQKRFSPNAICEYFAFLLITQQFADFYIKLNHPIEKSAQS